MSERTMRLEVVAGNAAGMSVLVEDQLVLGRHAVGAGQLAQDDEISRTHARLVLDHAGLCVVEDLGSTNGTFVNGLRISTPQSLSVGDTIELGGTTLVVRDLPGATAPAPATAQAPAAASEPSRKQTIAAGLPALPATAPEPAMPTPVIATTSPPPLLSIRLDIDFAGQEAALFLGDGDATVRLVLDGGAWRAAPTPPTETGDQA